MPDSGFLSSAEEQSLPAPHVEPPVPQTESVPSPSQTPVEAAVPISFEGEDEEAKAERQAALQMDAEQQEGFLEMAEAAPMSGVIHEQVPSQSAAPAAASPIVMKKDEVMIEVEKILEDGLEGYFDQLPEEAKPRFRQKGEEVAMQIAGMVRTFRVQVKKVLLLIRDWLLTIPGVNKFFLEQEAKIKTDRVIELEKVRRGGPRI